MTATSPAAVEALHVFFDDCTWVIASSPEDATAASDEAGWGHPDPESWEQLPDDRIVKVWCDANGDPCDIDSGTLTGRTCAEWVAKMGRGPFSTTEV